MSGPKHRPSEVGYGRPPVESQFQKGQSGNPLGRPKASRTIAAKINDELEASITAVEGGKRIAITTRQAAVRSLIKRALGGDVRALEIVLQQARTSEPKERRRRIILQFGDKKWTDGKVEGQGIFPEGDV
jgi:hypothetical protein